MIKLNRLATAAAAACAMYAVCAPAALAQFVAAPDALPAAAPAGAAVFKGRGSRFGMAGARQCAAVTEPNLLSM